MEETNVPYNGADEEPRGHNPLFHLATCHSPSIDSTVAPLRCLDSQTERVGSMNLLIHWIETVSKKSLEKLESS